MINTFDVSDSNVTFVIILKLFVTCSFYALGLSHAKIVFAFSKRHFLLLKMMLPKQQVSFMQNHCNPIKPKNDVVTLPHVLALKIMMSLV